jgi:large subunit ribosomal protein L12
MRVEVVPIEYIYASLLLYRAGKEINEENVKKVLEAAGVAVDEVRVKSLVAALKTIDIGKVLEQALAAPVAAAPVAQPAQPQQPAAEKKEEEKKEEEKQETISEEQLAEGLGALFGM